MLTWSDPRTVELAPGLGLNLAGTHRPARIDEWHLVDLLVIANNSVMFFVIGLTLHLSLPKDYLSPLASLSLIEFAASPIAAARPLFVVSNAMFLAVALPVIMILLRRQQKYRVRAV